MLEKEKKGITTLRFYQFWIFHHTMSETCFELLKSSEYYILWCYKSSNFYDCSEVRSDDSQIHSYY